MRSTLRVIGRVAKKDVEAVFQNSLLVATKKVIVQLA